MSAAAEVPVGERLPLTCGWELARTAPGEVTDVGALDGLAWRPAVVPGTVALALGPDADGLDVDAFDWWFRVTFAAEPAGPGEEVVLTLEGLATIAEVHLNELLVLRSESMFAGHAVDVSTRLRGDGNRLAICCRALAPRLAQRRRPRARWRTTLVAEGNLRFIRTMLLGRAPGFAPGPAVAGPWRPVALQRRRGIVAEDVRLRARVTANGGGVVECAATLRAIAGAAAPERATLAIIGSDATIEAELGVTEGARVSGTVTLPAPERWWPHTHGRPVLYEASLSAGGARLLTRRIGFRELRAAADLAADGLSLHINGVAIFARGAVWTPPGLRAPTASGAELRATLERVVAGGMNMLRVPGTAAYESAAFHDLCDELGILVWQDFMFANLDYPEADDVFMAAVAAEARGVLAGLAHRPSLAVLCGGSEVAQQVAMLGLDPALAEGPLSAELLPASVAEAGIDAPYVPSAPWGGDLPFRTDRGVANYYGVGAYRRPLEDARRAEVRFAAECLAFANVPDAAALADLHAPGGLSVGHPAWKAGVPRDAGAGWDFDDVRDHYLRTLFGVDPIAVRSLDPDRYLELSRTVSGEVMAEVMGEWRRPGSPCRGALVLWLRDLVPGAGWGVLDHRGAPKVCWHHLSRALAPVAVWSTDEGLGGVVAHVANDLDRPLAATLRVALYRGGAVPVEEASVEVALAAHGAASVNIESVLGRFVDAAGAYGFGPPGHDVIALSLEAGPDTLIAQAFRFPAGRPIAAQPAAELGLEAVLTPAGTAWALQIRTRRLAYGVRIDAPGHLPSDDAFTVEPGHGRMILLRPASHDGVSAPPEASLAALNLAGRVRAQPPG